MSRVPFRLLTIALCVGVAPIPAALPVAAVATQRPTPVTGEGGPVQADAVQAAVRSYLDRQRPAILRELADLLALPNVASNRDDVRRNADLLVEMLQRRGLEAELLTVPDAPPAVYGELASPGASRTVVFYAHYDGQPVEAADWVSDPWTPVLRDRSLAAGGGTIAWPEKSSAMNDEWRLYGRSASDDKSPIIAMLAALDALREAGLSPSVNVKLFLEGEEEAGSPNLERLLEQHKKKLGSDVWLICDGPRHQSRRMQVFFGARGVVDLELTLYGPGRPLHSGHYGNWAPNPIGMLSHLLAGMRDPEGIVTIPGFYDAVRPLTTAEARALEGVPDQREALMDEIGLARTEGEGRSLEEAIMRPAMNYRGISAGGVGERARNAISTEARASIDFRLVPDQTPAMVRRQVESYLRDLGYHVMHDVPDAETRREHARIVRLQWGPGYPPARTSLSLPMSRAIVQVLTEAIGEPIVEMPTLGGSVPLFLFNKVLDTPAIGVPIVNHDNNQHGADENIRLGNLWDGIAMYAGLMARLGQVWDDPSVKGTRPRGD